MEISFNIKDLLEKHNRVVLPGLGTFYKNRIEGFFDEAKSTFFPPKETIAFISSETDNLSGEDSLIRYICRSKNVSPASAKYILSKYVEDLKKDFKEKGELNFKNVGTLKLQGSEIVLEAEEAESGHSFFGLPVFEVPDTAASEAKPQIQNFSLAEQALSTAISDEELSELELKPKSKTWLYVLLSLVIIALSISTFYLLRPDMYNEVLNQIKNFKIKNVAPPVITSEERETRIADSIYKDNIVKNLESEGFEVENVKDSADVTVKEKIVPNKNNIRYEVIIAAWQTRVKAEAHLKKLRTNGINAHIVEDADGLMIKISAATLYNQKDAEKELNRIREELNPEAFIKPIRPLN